MNARPKKIPKTVPMINSVSSSESESGVAEENKKAWLRDNPERTFFVRDILDSSISSKLFFLEV